MSFKHGPPLGYRRYMGWDWKDIRLPAGRRWVIYQKPGLTFLTYKALREHIRTELGERPRTEEV